MNILRVLKAEEKKWSLQLEGVLASLAVIAVIVGFALGTNPQEIKSAPTLEVCKAQVNLWIAQTDISRSYGPETRKVMKTLTSGEISNRERVVVDCALAAIKELKAIPEGPQRVAKLQKLGMRIDEAQTLVHLYSAEQRTRYFNFIARNNLMQKFDQEDKAGER